MIIFFFGDFLKVEKMLREDYFLEFESFKFKFFVLVIIK